MIARAAITKGKGSFSIEEITINKPGPDEVLVELQASGICHTDWDSLSWGKTMIIGHEGAGKVLQTGSAVNHVAPGDSVLLNWAISCGQCFQCTRGNHAICELNSPVAGHNPLDGHARLESSMHEGEGIERSFNIGTLSTHTVVRKEAVFKIDSHIPAASAAIVGCGVMTGYGSVINASNIKAGETAVIIGCGGVGLNVIQGARIAEAGEIIAIDLKPSRLEMAQKFGATQVIQAKPDDHNLEEVHQQVLHYTDGRGADYAFECTGVPALGAAPLLMIRHGGTALQISGIEEEITIDMNLFEWDKTYLNPLYGKCNPQRDFPKIFKLYHQGKLLLDELVTTTYKLDELDRAFEDMLSGKNAKGVILF